MKTKTFQVSESRFQFICPHCRTRRMLTVAPSLRRKNVRCHRCAESTKCLLNRRNKPREPQSGKVLLVTSSGAEIEIFLHDVSFKGLGFLIPPGTPGSSQIAIGKKVRFKCNWNPRLIGNNFFVIRNIQGQKIGAERV